MRLIVITECTEHPVKRILQSSGGAIALYHESLICHTFPADAGAVERGAGCMIMTGAGGHAARSVQTRWTHCLTVLTLRRRD